MVFFTIYIGTRLLFRPSRSFPKVKHLHIIKLLMDGEKITAFAQMLKERSHSTESTKKQKRSEIVFLHKRSYDKVSIA